MNLVSISLALAILMPLLLVARIAMLRRARRRFAQGSESAIVYENWGVLNRKPPFVRTSARITLTADELRVAGVLVNKVFSKRDTAMTAVTDVGISSTSNVTIRDHAGAETSFWWFDAPALGRALVQSDWPVTT